MKPSSDNKPHLLITVGIPGSGKSYFAEHFAETFKAPIVSHERIRSSVGDIDGDGILDDCVDYMLDEMLKTGRTVVYDGPSGTRAKRMDIAQKARTAGYEPLFVWVQTDEGTAKKRAGKSSDEHKFALTNDVFDSHINRFSAPHKTEKAVVISGKHNYSSQLKIVLKNLVSQAAKTEQQSSNNNNRHFLIR